MQTDIPNRIKKAVKYLHTELGDDCRMFFFGSRVRGDAAKSSDWDLGVEAEDILDWNRFSFVKIQAQEMAWPYRLDIVDMNRAPDTFKKSVGVSAVDFKAMLVE